MATHKLPETQDEPDVEPHGLSKQYRTGGFGYPATEGSEPAVIVLGSRPCMNCHRPHMGSEGWCARCSGESTYNHAAWLRSHIKMQLRSAAFCRANGPADDAVWHEQRARELELELEHELERRR